MEKKSDRRIGRRSFLKGAAALGGLAAAGGLGALSGVLGGCAPAKPAVKQVRVATLLPLTGVIAGWGEPAKMSIDLVVEEINKAGGIKSLGGAEIVVDSYDYESKNELAGALAEKIARTDAVAAIGVIASGPSYIASSAFERERVPQIELGAGDDRLRERGYSHFFCLGCTNTMYGKQTTGCVNWLCQKTGACPQKVAGLTIDTPSATLMTETALAEASTLGWEVYDMVKYPFAAPPDFVPVMSRFKEAGVDLVFQVAQPPDAVSSARAMIELDYNPISVLAMTGGHYAIEYGETLGNHADYTTVTAYFASDLKIPGLQEYRSRFKERYGRDMESMAAMGACSVAVLQDALERAGVADREALRRAIADTDLTAGGYYLTPMGCKFDGKGQNIRQRSVVFQWVKGEQLSIYPEEYAGVEPVWPKPHWGAS